MRGWAELFLCATVLVAAWTRTPIGAVVHNAVATVRGTPTTDVLASFRTELPDRVNQSIERALTNQPPPEPVASLGAAWSPALRTAISAHLGPEALAAIDAHSAQEAPPEQVLEAWAIGADLRDRAVQRARAAGEATPESLESHRRYLPADAARRAEEAVSEVLALSTALDLAWPVERTARVTSPFGYRDHPVLHTRKLHEGVDIAVPVGTAVKAAGDGQVARSREDKVNGRYLVVDHGHGVRTSYCHGDQLLVEKGAAVSRGQHVMNSGNTGRSTGAHLHFGLRIHGRPADPAPFLGTAISSNAGASGSPMGG